MASLLRAMSRALSFGASDECSSTMQEHQLLVTHFLDHAAKHHSTQRASDAAADGSAGSVTYKVLQLRSKALMLALERQGMRRGDVVATLAWNSIRHLEAYYALMGAGCVCHPLNPRLHAEQLLAIMQHANDRVLMVEPSFIPLLESVAERLPRFACIVVMAAQEDMPAATRLPRLCCYEDLVTAEMPVVETKAVPWRATNERDACGMCYTSGTTGEPKGVVYSHRSQVLTTYAVNQPDCFAIKATDVVLLAVPMFHASGWCLPFVAPMVGARLVLPGPNLSPEALYARLTSEQVTVAAGVPTIWTGLLAYLRQDASRAVPCLLRVFVAGSALTPALITGFESYGVKLIHLWGMTECTSGVAWGIEKPGVPGREASLEQRVEFGMKQGRAAPPFDFKIIDDSGLELPWDGASVGRFMVKGPSCTARYHKVASVLDRDGWLDTGDMATVDEHGMMQLVDRSKDLIRSGGEWISSQKLEQLACSCEGVAAAAAVAVPDSKWGERPLLLVQALEPSHVVDKDAILLRLAQHVPKWWLPDHVVQLEALPVGTSGKLNKAALRTTYSTWRDRQQDTCRVSKCAVP